MSDNTNLNHVAQIIYNALERKLPDDLAYLEDKHDVLLEQNKIQSVMYICNLDSECRADVADQFGIKVDQLNLALEVMKVIY